MSALHRDTAHGRVLPLETTQGSSHQKRLPSYVLCPSVTCNKKDIHIRGQGEKKALGRRDGDALTGRVQPTPLLVHLLAAEGTTGAELKKKLPWLNRRSLCHPALPAVWPQHQRCPQGVRRAQEEQSHSLWPPSTCFNLPRHTGGFVHCPLRQVIVADPSKV